MPRKKTAPATEEKKNETAAVYDTEGKSGEHITLPKDLFAIPVSDALIAQYVRVYLANQRQGTQRVKTRGEVVGSTRKIYRQKGTGRARHGSRKAPLFVGGGAAHAPHPRDYSLAMNKKQKRQALCGALSHKASQKSIIVVNGLLTIEPKTKKIVALLKNLSLTDGKSILFVAPKGKHVSLRRAVSNIDGVCYTTFPSLNAHTVLRHAHLIFAQEVFEPIKKEGQLP